MKKNIIFNLIAFIVLAFFISLSSYPYIHAETKAEAQNYSTTATVPSPVSVKKSTVDLNASEVLAEPESHSILLTVTLKDDEQKPISNRKVEVVSNRGIVDVIEAVSKFPSSKFKPLNRGQFLHCSLMKRTKTVRPLLELPALSPANQFYQ